MSTPSLFIDFNSVPILGFARAIIRNNITNNSKTSFRLSLKFDLLGLIWSNSLLFEKYF